MAISAEIVATAYDLMEKGYLEEIIEENLRGMGYNDEDIAEIIRQAKEFKAEQKEDQTKMLAMAVGGLFLLLIMAMAAYVLFLA